MEMGELKEDVLEEGKELVGATHQPLSNTGAGGVSDIHGATFPNN